MNVELLFILSGKLMLVSKTAEKGYKPSGKNMRHVLNACKLIGFSPAA
jgi:hypothetical protein